MTNNDNAWSRRKTSKWNQKIKKSIRIKRIQGVIWYPIDNITICSKKNRLKTNVGSKKKWKMKDIWKERYRKAEVDELVGDYAAAAAWKKGIKWSEGRKYGSELGLEKIYIQFLMGSGPISN